MTEKFDAIRWFLSELSSLQSAGIIDGDTREKLAGHYSDRLETAPPPQRYFAFVLAVFGGIMVAAGLVLFFNYNWDMLDRHLRIGIAALPLMVACGLALVSLIGGRGQLMRELSALATAVGIAVLLAMLSRIYHTGGELSEFATLVLLCSLPFIYIFNSVSLATIYVFGLFAVVSGGADSAVGGFWLTVGAAPFLCWHLQEISPFKIWMRYLAMVLALEFFVVTLLFYGFVPFASFVFCNVFLLAGWEYHRMGDGMWRNPWLVCAFVGLLTLLGVASSSEYFWRCDDHPEACQLAYYWSGTGVMLAISIVLFFRRVWDGKRIMFALLLMLGAAGFFLSEGRMLWLTNICLGLFGLVLMFDGGRRQKVLTFNGGLLMLTVLVVCRFFDSDLGLLIRSGTFVVMGLGFIVANVLFSRRKGLEAGK